MRILSVFLVGFVVGVMVVLAAQSAIKNELVNYRINRFWESDDPCMIQKWAYRFAKQGKEWDTLTAVFMYLPPAKTPAELELHQIAAVRALSKSGCFKDLFPTFAYGAMPSSAGKNLRMECVSILNDGLHSNIVRSLLPIAKQLSLEKDANVLNAKVNLLCHILFIDKDQVKTMLKGDTNSVELISKLFVNRIRELGYVKLLSPEAAPNISN